MMAYDETIEGWSRALDLRDKETEGHTQRVTELTLRLAEQPGRRGRRAGPHPAGRLAARYWQDGRPGRDPAQTRSADR